MSEELAKYMDKIGVKCRYIHSEVDTMERVEILRDLRLGRFDVLIGVNLLREGLSADRVFKVGSPILEIYNNYKDKIDNSDIISKLKLTKKN